VLTQVISWISDSGDGVFIGGDNQPDDITDISLKTMTYSHSLQQVKFSLLLQRMFGNRYPAYDADRIRTTDGLNRNYSTTPLKDSLNIRHDNPIDADSYSFNMQTGRFLEVADRRKNYMRINGMEEFFGYHSDAKMNITGTEVSNQIATGTGDDYVQGMGGNDTIRGKGGDDVLSGGAGNDYIDAGSNDDLVIGGEGFDTLRGGIGADTFRISTGHGMDHIMDFNDGQDKIEIRAIDGFENVVVRQGADGNARIFNIDGHTMVAVVYGVDAADLTVQGEVIV